MRFRGVSNVNSALLFEGSYLLNIVAFYHCEELVLYQCSVIRFRGVSNVNSALLFEGSYLLNIVAFYHYEELVL